MMERRFERRKAELLSDCQVPPAVFGGMLERLEQFAQPFVGCLRRPEQRVHAQTYLHGLLSDLERKNAESIAYRHDEERQGLQAFIGTAPWDHHPLIDELGGQVGRELGEEDGVIVFDPSAFPKKGRHSVGVARQWCGRLGKVDNCQVGVFMGYVSRREHALVEMRLYLPQAWLQDRRRCREAGIPRAARRHRTRHQLALEMLDTQGGRLPHGWIAGDDELGRPAWFRWALAGRGERYLLAVPSTTTIRDLEAKPPPYGGQGRPPQPPFQQLRRWGQAIPEVAWRRQQVREGEKGPLIVEILQRRVVTKIDRKVGPEEQLVVIRRADDEGTVQYDYYVSNAPADTSLAEWARVANAAHRIEECIERGKSQAGLADYQVRTWMGWHHHITLALMASWFLVQEARRGKKMDAGAHRAPSPPRLGADPSPRLAQRYAGAHPPRMRAPTAAQRTGAALSLQST